MIKDCDERILSETIKLGALVGVGRQTSTKEIACACGINEATIFTHFKTKENLLRQAFLTIDRKIAAKIAESAFDVTDLRASVRKLWDSYMDFLLERPTETTYYCNYRRSVYYNADTQAEQKPYWSAFVAMVGEVNSKLVDLDKLFDPSLFWVIIVDNTLLAATFFAQKPEERTGKNYDFVFGTIFEYIFQKIESQNSKNRTQSQEARKGEGK